MLRLPPSPFPKPHTNLPSAHKLPEQAWIRITYILQGAKRNAGPVYKTLHPDSPPGTRRKKISRFRFRVARVGGNRKHSRKVRRPPYPNPSPPVICPVRRAIPRPGGEIRPIRGPIWSDPPLGFAFFFPQGPQRKREQSRWRGREARACSRPRLRRPRLRRRTRGRRPPSPAPPAPASRRAPPFSSPHSLAYYGVLSLDFGLARAVACFYGPL
jgi:hypothetical protein